MLEGLPAEARAALDEAGRRIGFAVALAMMVLAGVGFGVAALWTLAASAWGAAAASGAFAAGFFAAAAASWLVAKTVARRSELEAEIARSRRAARVDALLAAFRIGADLGSGLSRRRGT